MLCIINHDYITIIDIMIIGMMTILHITTGVQLNVLTCNFRLPLNLHINNLGVILSLGNTKVTLPSGQNYMHVCYFYCYVIRLIQKLCYFR